MTSDGRGQRLPLTLWERVVRWATANPMMGILGLLLAALGVSRLRVRHLEGRAASAQKRADLARHELSKHAALVKEKEHTRRQAAVSKAIEAGQKKEAEAKDRGDAAGKRLRDRAGRWPTKALLIGMAATTSLYAAETALPDVCAEQPNLTGLADALTASAGRFSGLDVLMVTDAAGALTDYRELVAALCDRLEARKAVADAAVEGRTIALGTLRLCAEDRAACWSELEARIKKPTVIRRSRLLTCVGGAYGGAGFDGEFRLGLGLACGIPLF